MILITVYTDFFTTLFHIYNPHPAPSGKAVTEMQADVRVSDCNQLAESKKQSQEKPAWNLHKPPPPSPEEIPEYLPQRGLHPFREIKIKPGLSRAL